MNPLTDILRRIRLLLLTQRSARLFLRSLWLGLAGYLLGWGAYTLWGALADVRLWIALGLLIAMPAVIAAFRLPSVERLVWGLDRGFETREQISAAWQRGGEPDGELSALLDADVLALLPDQRKKIFRRGWALGPDVEALGLIALLVAVIAWAGSLSRPVVPAAVDPAGLTPLAVAPSFEDIFPSGVPGLTEAGLVDPAGEGQQASPGALPDLENILSDLGEALSESLETSEAGEALQNGDLGGAAAAVEQLADRVDLIPEQARLNAQEAFQQAAQQARQAGQDDLADDLERAAQALGNPDPNSPLAADALDDLADQLRGLSELFATMAAAGGLEAPPEGEQPDVGSSGGSTGAGGAGGSGGQPEPLGRLEGEGGELDFSGGDDPSGLLTPAPTGSLPGGSSGGTSILISGGNTTGAILINGILTPYHFFWKYRDVVTGYFSPPQ